MSALPFTTNYNSIQKRRHNATTAGIPVIVRPFSTITIRIAA